MSIKRLLYTLVISILCILTKKVGGYVIISSFIILLLLNLKKWKKLGTIILLNLLFMFIIQPNILKAFNITPGGKQEKYCMLFQQTARYVKTYPNDVTDEEKEIIYRVLYYHTLALRYNPIIADPVKGNFQIGQDEDYLRYMIVWLRQGLRHPRVYLKATNAMLSGSFSFEKYITKTDMNWHDRFDSSFMNEEITVRNKTFQKSTDFIVSMYNKFYEIPVIGKVFSYGFWTALVPVFLGITLIKYRKNNFKNKGFVVIIPLIASVVLGIWLGPVSAEQGLEGMRYVYPIIYTVPMTLMWCFYCVKNNIEYKNT